MLDIHFFCAILALGAVPARGALNIDLKSPKSIKENAKLVAANLLTYYKGDQPGQIRGILPGPPPGGEYYWWEGGAMWGTLVDYWHYTGDTTYNNETEASLVFQANPPYNDYMPPNHTASLGNDDQGFWGMSAMLAAENNFQNPPPDQAQWLALAQAVFNTQAARWDTQFCGGGLRWQVPPTNKGYNYKNSIANGILFNLGARLARYTNNDTYAQWSYKIWDWMLGVGFIDLHDYSIYDGGHVEHNCTDTMKAQFSYNAGVWIQGLGFLHNYTKGDPKWTNHLSKLTKSTIDTFFSTGAAVEIPCELADRVQCTTDMLSFKGYLHRWLAQTIQVAPFLRETLFPVLKSSAEGMTKSCNPDGTCGFRWNTGAYDGLTGAGQQMNALGALMSLLVLEEGHPPPVTNLTGGTSVGNPAGGGKTRPELVLKPITGADRAGAGILTTLTLALITGAFAWMSLGFGEA